MAEIKSIEQALVAGERVLLRVDFNVPIKDNEVTDDTRIKAALPTIKHLLDRGARVVLLSHLGRPQGIGYEIEYSLRPVAYHLSELLGQEVMFSKSIYGDEAIAYTKALLPGEIMMIENLRFDSREKDNNPNFCMELARLGDIYVNDAFGTAHRDHASTAGLPIFLPSYAGLLLDKELKTLQGMLDEPKRPFVAILGGSKVSDKIKIIDALIDKCDTLIIGGGMCFTFLLAKGYAVGSSLKEEDWVDRCKTMLEKAKKQNVKILLPLDVVVAEQFADDVPTDVVSVKAIPANKMGLDIGPSTARLFAHAISEAGSVFWNGPMGVFEMKPFEAGTKVVAEAVAKCKGDTIIGGGDSVAAVNKFNLAKEMTFISTGGGASMELVQGEALPGIEVLKLMI